MELLDLIFPKKCVSCGKAGDYVCENCFSKLSFNSKNTCLVCQRLNFNNFIHKRCIGKNSIDGCFSAVSYNSVSRKLLFSFKNKPYLLSLQKIITELFYESIIQNETFINLLEKEEWVLVPLPLSFSKLRKRGYNQAEILSKNLSKLLNITTVNMLSRNDKKEFVLRSKFRQNAHKKILLVDDLVRSGKTLKDATFILKENGAKEVFGLTFARG